MNNSPLDEHIKQKFGDYTPDVPPHIWENIMAERDKRKPAGFWFSFLNRNILLLLLVLAGAGTGIIIYKNISPQNSDTASNRSSYPINIGNSSVTITKPQTEPTAQQTGTTT